MAGLLFAKDRGGPGSNESEIALNLDLGKVSVKFSMPWSLVLGVACAERCKIFALLGVCGELLLAIHMVLSFIELKNALGLNSAAVAPGVEFGSRDRGV